jgi:crotonobetainyl-CoA:carnitine CoA-transferase CaiB-like acyl-CoA transferase
VVGLIAERRASRRAREGPAALEPAGVPCGPINDLAQVFADPQVRHRGMQVSAPHGVAGEVKMVANPIRFSATPISHDHPPPQLGEHTDEVLQRVLGMSAAAIAQLRANGTI